MANNLGFGNNPFLGQNNPYLQQNIDATLGDITRNYNTAVKPQTESAMVGSGSFGNSGLQQMQGEQQRNLAQQLGNTAGNMRMQDYNQQQNMYLGQGNLDLGNRTADQNYNLGQGQLQNQARSTANQYDLGLRSSDLGFGQLDANINQQNFNNQLSGANFGLNMYDRLNANNAAGINAASTIQNTPMQYQQQFANLANSYGGQGGANSASTQMPGNPVMGALGGWQLGNSFNRG